MHLQSCNDLSTTAAALDTTCRPPSPGLLVRGHFDLVSDVLGLRLDTRFHVGAANTWIRVADRYRLVGLPAGTPVPVTIRLSLSPSVNARDGGDFFASATGGAKLEVDGVVVAQASRTVACNQNGMYTGCTTTGDLSSSLSANIVVQAEQDFVVTAELSASVAGGTYNLGGVNIEAGFHFDDLPPGVTVVSCHESVVPVRATTWGKLKTRYR